MNKPLLTLLLSIIKTAVIAGIVAAIAAYTGHSALLWFVVTFLAQFVLFYAVNSIIEYRASVKMKEFLLKEAEIIAMNTVSCECASCKKENKVMVRAGQENRFICGHCKVKNSVYLQAITAVVTEPMYEEQPLPNVNPDINTDGN